MRGAAHVLLAGGYVESFPLVFTFRDLIAGQGFIAAIQTWGRIILTRESEGWTLYGVNPASVAGGAEDRAAALDDFRRTYAEVLDDIAHSSEDFASFKAAVEALVGETNDEAATEWSALRECVRSGKLSLENLGQRPTSDFVPRVEVSRIEPAPAPRAAVSPTPDLNPGGEYLNAA